MTALEQRFDDNARPVVLFVLGMARSGTSALTRVLSLCGGALPTGMVGAFEDNPLGYWEPRRAVHLNEAILRRRGSAGFDPSLRMHDEGTFADGEQEASISKVSAYLSTLPVVPVTVIKELQVTLLSDVWFEAARRAGLDVATIIAVRHPEEVIASYAKRGSGTSQELSASLWLKYSLLAERKTRDVPRVFVEYTDLLNDWRGVVHRVASTLDVELSADDVAVAEFLRQDLQHQRHCGPVIEHFGTDWFTVVYETLCAASRNEPWDESELDRVFEAYRTNERGLRTALEDYQRQRKGSRLTGPAFTRLALEVAAVAHRRRGTWA